MKTLVFATNNKNKALEISKLLHGKFEIKTLNEIGCTTDIPETGKTFEENALIKARYVKQHFGLDCFADDSGLEVEALGNEPGVHSARYASESKDDEANMQKLLSNLGGKENRSARFRTVIALISNGHEYLFDGSIKGSITNEKRGTNGFGYDPLFIPENSLKTFAEIPLEEKNKISHRAIATAKLIDALNTM